jgi:hypothetical protein
MDPQWDRVIEIAATLWVDGTYVTEIEPSPTQRFVDLQWAARQAGRVLGGRARVEIDDAGYPEEPCVTLTVTYVDAGGRDLRRAEEGLEALLRQALASRSDP